MIIKTSIRSSVVPSDKAPAVAAHSADDSHIVSVSPDIARTVPYRLGARSAADGSILEALGLAGGDEAERQLRSTVWKAAKAAVAGDPVAKGAIKGVELLLSSKVAVTKLADAKARPIARLDSTVAALSDAISAARTVFPALKDNNYVQVASLIVTVGGMVIHVEAELAAEKAA